MTDHTSTHQISTDRIGTGQVDYGLRHAQRTAYLIGSIDAWIGFAQDGHITPDEAVTEIRLLINDHHTAQRAEDKRADDERAEANR